MAGGVLGFLERASARLTSGSQPMAHNQVGRCSTFARQPARPRGWLAGDGSSGEARRQEKLWRQFFWDPALWWDNRQNGKGLLPDFRHRQSQEVLWLNNLHKPAWVDSQLAALDVGVVGRASNRSMHVPYPRRPAGYDGGVTAETVRWLCQEGHLTEAVEALEGLLPTDRCISGSVLYTVLRKCVAKQDVVLGSRVHAVAVKRGYQSDTFLGFHFLRMYAAHGRLQDAMDVFEAVAEPDSFTWSAIISAHVKHGQDKQAIQLYHRMRRSKAQPDGHVFVAALQACARGSDLKAGQQVHADVLANGAEPNLFVSSCLVDMYAKCGSLENAQRVFGSLGQKDVVTWNAMISGYSQQGMGQEAFGLYSAMLKEGIAAPDCVTFASLLSACASVGTPALEKGRQLHAQIKDRGYQGSLFLANSLVVMYAKCGSLKDAQRVFDGLGEKNVVTWNAMISGYSQQGMGQEALRLYSAMQEESLSVPNSVTFVCLLQACASVGSMALETGKRLHSQIDERGYQADVFVANSLVNMYSNCGSLGDAQRVFDGLGKKDSVTWNAIIAGYSHQGMGLEALRLYAAMREDGMAVPDSVTFVCLLQACASLGTLALDKGKQLHAQIKEGEHEADVVVANSLANMYVKCGSLEDAQRVFDRLGQKDVVTWNVMMTGYSQQGKGQEALLLYSAMLEEGAAVPTSVTFACLLQACASVGAPALERGKQLHAQIMEQGYEANEFITSCLVNMYSKCGSLKDAETVFGCLDEKDVVTWNAMIAGYSQQGMGQEALHLYSAMQAEGMAVADSVTFVCLLQACATVGSPALAKGKQLHAQIRERKHQADVFVTSSLVNMYAKCGSIEDAEIVFDGLGQKDAVTWNAMMAGYSQQGMGQEALRLYGLMLEEGTAVPDVVTYLSVLQACASIGAPALEQGKQLHAQIEERGHQADTVVANSLVSMYAKCGTLNAAQILFEGLGRKTVVTWNAMIAGYSQQGMGWKALSLYSSMLEEGMEPDLVTFLCLLHACASMGAVALEKGKQLHVQIKERGHESDVLVVNSLVNMYAKCLSLEDAQSLFDSIVVKDVVTWNVMIGGYSQQGMGQEALLLYSAMRAEGMALPDSVTFVCLLQACASLGTIALENGKELHAQIREQGHEADLFVSNSLVSMYGRCGSLEDAARVFDGLCQKDVVTWNAMIGGYAQNDLGQEALRLYGAMQEEGIVAPDSMTFVCLLQVCATAGTPALDKGKELHTQIKQRGLEVDMFVASSLIDMYSKCGNLEDARSVFDGLGQKDLVTWNAMIAGYSQQGVGQEALCLYRTMEEEGLAVPDAVTFVCLLQACASLGTLALENGKELHTQIREQGHEAHVIVASSLVNMYAKCGSLEDAQRVFDGLGQKDLVIWNAMMAGYSQQGMLQEALGLYIAMQEEGVTVPDSVTFVSLLQACASVGAPALGKGKELHVQIREQGHQDDVFVANSLVHMYAKCGSLKLGRRLFDTLGQKNVVTWNAMIAGYSQQGMGQEALHLYNAMQGEGKAVPDTVTFLCLLQACANVAALYLGRQLHVQILEQGLQADLFVAGSLINMYGKTGSTVDAQQVFDMLPERDVVIWNALIAGYTCQGDSEVVFDLVRRMKEDGIWPDSITFLSVLTACSHAGLVNKGRDYFEGMSRHYGILPTVYHYTCMVDLLGRAGQLDEALGLVSKMPGLPNATVWRTLLGACRKWCNVEVGLHAFNETVKLDSQDASAYVLMSNIYTSVQMWECAEKMQSRRKRIRAWKQPGQSWWTDGDGLVHSFLVGDEKHPQSYAWHV